MVAQMTKRAHKTHWYGSPAFRGCFTIRPLGRGRLVTNVPDAVTCRICRHHMKAAGFFAPRLSDLVPTTWLDPLLSGPDSPLNNKQGGTWGCQEIQALLNGIRARIRAKEDEK